MKCPITIKPAPQAPRLRIQCRIVLLIRIRDRIVIVRQPREKVFEILFFVPSNQQFRQISLPVKDEMPGRGIGFAVVVEGGAWERTFAPDDALGAVGELHGEGVGDHAADVVADNVDFAFHRQLFVDESVEIARHC